MLSLPPVHSERPFGEAAAPIPEIGQLYASLRQAINRLRSRYGGEEQALLPDFSTRVNRTFEEETLKLRGDR